MGVLLLWASFFEDGLGQTADSLLKDLACANCHSGISVASNIHDKAPNLSHAGLRFNPAYLFDYLQNPTQVRHHIGFSRMPNFFFDRKEALALVLFLEKQTQVEGKWPEYPTSLRSFQPKQLDKQESAAARKLLTTELRCTSCHTLEGAGENASTDLTAVGHRLRPEWLQRYLVAPHIFDGVKTAMPNFFYQLDVSQTKFSAMLPRPDEMIILISRYLAALEQNKREQLQRAFEKAKAEFPDINAGLGEKIFLSQNCVACHRHTALAASPSKNAPDLSLEGARVKKEWLFEYLKKPQPLRPFGFYPGSGSRMPDFKLAEAEAAMLGDYLLKQKHRTASTFQPRKLSAFSMAKAQTLLKEKLSCLGCHQLGNDGGRIGPNLSSLKNRLQPDFVYQFIQNPHGLQPETVMPKILMPPKTLDLIANFLLQQEIPAAVAPYLSLADHPIHAPHGQSEEESLYLKYCAACHGASGDGKGYNAKYLPKAPASHADKAYMSTRPDDTLFDGVYAGGYILNKHHFMPPWGQTLSHDEIRKLVAYMRKLCQCEGPLWSRQ
ncbi:MAG: c-type cytochrome [candidate division KSB1 bacterium]|nr:c-type cytochrome [candidate division KSB1 bacterium]MDZ7368751.1 c-type cytochrome [candidate division KSB1 bacterium]